jgi:cell division control protein 45
MQEYGLENVSYTGFVRVTGYKSLLSASDMSYAVTALLECSAAAMDGSAGGGGGGPDDDDDDDDDGAPLPPNEEDREDREMIEAFNVAFDALNSNGGGPSTSAAASGALASMLAEGGGVEGADMSNLVNGGSMTGTTGLGAGIRLAMTLQRNIMATARGLVDRNAITRLSHFRYAYLHCSGGGGGGGAGGRVVTPDAGRGGGDAAPPSASRRSDQFHVFAKPLVLTRLAHFLMDMHREDGKWTGTKSRPLVLLAEKPRSNTYMVVGYECPEEAGNVVRNRFGQNFELTAKSMLGTFWFDSFDSNVVEVAAKDVQKFLEQLHYMMEQV